MMQVSRKVDYALRAAIYLSVHGEVRPVTATEIAESRRIPKKFLEKIIKDMTRAGLLVSHRGALGGYTLARPSSHISFRDVIEAVDGPIVLNVCVNEGHDCSVMTTCNMQRVWREGQRRMLEFFAGTTLADLNPVNSLNSIQEAAV